ncbi:MAG: hypothetical protein E6Q98_26110 [Rhodospirillaceae bacterium]|nr:MAG: hypothetical protein E6Q98_26110 [Rhodospirillaceae bacterium]
MRISHVPIRIAAISASTHQIVRYIAGFREFAEGAKHEIEVFDDIAIAKELATDTVPSRRARVVKCSYIVVTFRIDLAKHKDITATLSP